LDKINRWNTQCSEQRSYRDIDAIRAVHGDAFDDRSLKSDRIYVDRLLSADIDEVSRLVHNAELQHR